MNLAAVVSLLVAILRAVPALMSLADRVETAQRLQTAAAEKRGKDARNAAAIKAANGGTP